jgi:inorganic triphosphatase YgiF
MELERELKFSLLDPPPPADELELAFRGSGFALHHQGTTRHLDRYYDDDARSLEAAGVALRRRHAGGIVTAGLKTAGAVEGAAHTRGEAEARASCDAWPEQVASALRERVGGDLDPSALRPRVEIETERTSYLVLEGERTVATLAFDDVSARYPGGEREALFREAELEAAAGVDLAVLDAVALRLERVMTLTPSGVTKLQRAEALLMLGAAF